MMTSILWIVGLIAFVLLAVIVYIRLTDSVQRKLASEQAKLDKKREGYGVTTASPSAKPGSKEKGWLENWFLWGLALIILIVVALYHWGLGWFTFKMSVTEVAEWGSGYWFQILVVCGVLLLLFGWLGADEDPKKPGRYGRLQTAVWVAAATLIIGLPLLAWFKSPSKVFAHAEHTGIPLSSWPVSDWPQLVIPAGGRSELIPIRPGKRVEIIGKGIRVHCVYRDRREIDYGEGEEACPPGDMPFVYATDISSEGPNIVLYAFAPARSSFLLGGSTAE